MDWQDQADFLQRWPELHSLLGAYIAIEEGEVAEAVRAFKHENKAQVQQRVSEQLQELFNAPQCWDAAARFAAVEPQDAKHWLDELNDIWIQTKC